MLPSKSNHAAVSESPLLTEITFDNLMDRLQYLKNYEPQQLLQIYAPTALSLSKLRSIFPKTKIITIDHNWKNLADLKKKQDPQGWRSWFQSSLFFPAAGDLKKLPLADNSVDGIICNAVGLSAPSTLVSYYFQEWLRVLKPGQILTFAALGHGSGMEWQNIMKNHEVPFHIPLVSMPHVGDHLIGLGYQDVVIDKEIISFSYATFHQLLDDLKRHEYELPGKISHSRWQKILKKYKKDHKSYTINFEIIYGYGCKPNSSSIKFIPIRSQGLSNNPFNLETV